MIYVANFLWYSDPLVGNVMKCVLMLLYGKYGCHNRPSSQKSNIIILDSYISSIIRIIQLSFPLETCIGMSFKYDLLLLTCTEVQRKV